MLELALCMAWVRDYATAATATAATWTEEQDRVRVILAEGHFFSGAMDNERICGLRVIQVSLDYLKLEVCHKSQRESSQKVLECLPRAKIDNQPVFHKIAWRHLFRLTKIFFVDALVSGGNIGSSASFLLQGCERTSKTPSRKRGASSSTCQHIVCAWVSNTALSMRAALLISL